MPAVDNGPPPSPSGGSVTAFLVSSASYVIAGPMLILVNNSILKGFPFPIALSACGVAFAAVASRLLLLSGVMKFSPLPSVYPSPGVASWRFYWLNALPIGAMSALTLALGNASYVHLSISMCQMLKALTPAMTFMLLLALRIETPTRREALCVLVITLGTLVATRGDLAVSRLGLLLQLGANASEALRLVLSQKLLANVKLPLFEMQYHVAPPQLLCLAVASALLELRTPAAREAAAASVVESPWPFVAAGVLGLLLQVVGLLTVKATGSVTFKLLGIARGAGLVMYELLAGPAGAAPPSSTQLSGYLTAIGGFGVYSFARLQRHAAESKPKAQ